MWRYQISHVCSSFRYRAPGKISWRQRFSYVIGIIHTNYKAYASSQLSGLVLSPVVGALSAWFVRAYCDKVIKLSNVLQDYAPEKELVCNVHGIRREFLNVPRPTGNKVYFLGKLLWAKGLDKMLELQGAYRRTGSYFPLDVFGSGPDEKDIARAFLGDGTCPADGSSMPSSWKTRRSRMPVRFFGRHDHAKVSSEYKVFVNPSVTEVLCTTTAEALAMGKFVIIPHHLSNVFFQQFSNCLSYNHRTEFVALLQYALAHDPEPLTNELRHMLTWEAATDRFFRAAATSERDAARRDRLGKHDDRLVDWHYELSKGSTGDVLRKVLGGGPVADQSHYHRTMKTNAKLHTVAQRANMDSSHVLACGRAVVKCM